MYFGSSIKMARTEETVRQNPKAKVANVKLTRLLHTGKSREKDRTVLGNLLDCLPCMSPWRCVARRPSGQPNLNNTCNYVTRRRWTLPGSKPGMGDGEKPAILGHSPSWAQAARAEVNKSGLNPTLIFHWGIDHFYSPSYKCWLFYPIFEPNTLAIPKWNATW